MAFIPVPNTARISVRATLFGQDIINVLWAKGPGPISSAGLLNAATLVRNAYDADILPELSQDIAYQDVTARAMDTDSGPQVVLPWGEGNLGGEPIPSMSGNVAFVITHRTANIGRSYRGRTYLAGLPEASVANNQLDQTVADALAAGFNAIRTGLATANLTLCIVSLISGGAPRLEGVATPVTASLARNTRVDTQRRRLG